MPKPRFPYTYMFNKFYDDFGDVRGYQRFYLREDGKFIPSGWKVEFIRWESVDGRVKGVQSTQYVLDEDIKKNPLGA